MVCPGLMNRLTQAVAAARNIAPRNSDGGSSDPYCILYYGDKKEKTKPVLKTLNPIWNESFVFVADVRLQSFKIEVPALGGVGIIDFSDVRRWNTQR